MGEMSVAAHALILSTGDPADLYTTLGMQDDDCRLLGLNHDRHNRQSLNPGGRRADFEISLIDLNLSPRYV